jgi:hypothetical protein
MFWALATEGADAQTKRNSHHYFVGISLLSGGFALRPTEGDGPIQAAWPRTGNRRTELPGRVA